MEPSALADVLHQLVGWGLAPARAQKHASLRELLPVRRRALQRFGSAGNEELAHSATQLIVESVAAQPDPVRQAAQELLWITDEGQRPRNRLPLARTRRSRAIEVLAQSGYFRAGNVPNEEVWRRGQETDFFAPIAQTLLNHAEAKDEPAGTPSSVPPPKSNPNVDYDLVLVESHFELYSDKHGYIWETVSVRARQSGVAHYEVGWDYDPETPPQDYAFRGAAVEDKVAPRAMREERILLRFPNPLQLGEVHTFSHGRLIYDEIEGMDMHFHVAGESPAQEVHMRVLFPADDLPDKVCRVIAPVNALQRGGDEQAHPLEGRLAQTLFLDLQPGLAYGFRFQWDRDHSNIPAAAP